MSKTTGEVPESPLDELKVELERTKIRAERAELENRRLRDEQQSRGHRVVLMGRALDVVRVPVWIAALWIPITAALPIADTLAGESTHFEASVGLSLTLATGLTISLAVTLRWGILRKRKVKRLRERVDVLERRCFEQQELIDKLEEKLGTPPLEDEGRYAH